MGLLKQNPSNNDIHRVGNNTYKWNGKGWRIEAGGITGSVSTTKRTEFTATANQTVFTLPYTSGYIDVYLNGIHLDSSDYTASNGTSIVLGTGVPAGAELYVLSYGKFVVADHYDKTETDTHINNSIDALVDGAPGALNTLKEISTALNNDNDLAGTITTSLAGKADKTTTYTKAEVDAKVDALEALIYGLTHSH